MRDGGKRDIPDPLYQHAEQRFRILFDHAPFSALLFAPDGRILFVNRAWQSLWDVNGDAATLAFVYNEYNILKDPQLDAWGVTPCLQRALAGESSSSAPVHYDPAKAGRRGRTRWVKTHAHPLLNPDGQVREVMLIHEDLTELQEIETHLRQAEERLRLATEAGNIGIWAWDMVEDRLEWSERVYRLHGIRPGQFSGRVADFAQLVHPDDLPRLRRALDEALASQSIYSSEFRALLPDGDVRWLSSWARVHTDDEGRPTRLVGATISIDAWKKAEQALKEGDRRKDEFLAMLAHELRNPLAPISSASQLLRVPGLPAATQLEAIEIIARQTSHMATLMDDLLDVSRVTRGLVVLQKETLDLHAVVANAVEQVRPLLEARRHQLVTALSEEPLCVYGDRTRLAQVLVNLLNNAAKYTPPGGHIEIRGFVRDRQIWLQVSDNGIGLEPGLQPHVFDLFIQAVRTPDRSQGGLGIGLPLVKSLMKLHGGRVEAYSAGSGKGSTFTLVLPQQTAAPTMSTPLPPPPQTERRRRSLRILIVDDNLDAARSLATLLELQGHAVSVREDAGSALLAAQAEPPEVFILDIGLPDIDGFTLARRLRAQPVLQGALYIALTGYGQPQDREQSRAAGFDHHFVKPLDMQALDRVLSALP